MKARAKCQSLPGLSETWQTASAESRLGAFPLSWSHYVRLLSVEKPHARAFYEAEAIRGGGTTARARMKGERA